MTSKVRLSYLAYAALLSFVLNSVLTMAFFTLPDSWPLTWTMLQILGYPGDTIVEKFIGNFHGLGLVGIAAAAVANFVIDWILISVAILFVRACLRGNPPNPLARHVQ